MLIVLSFLTGCDDVSPTASPTESIARTSTATSTPIETIAIVPSATPDYPSTPTPPPGLLSAAVTRVVDGDTIRVSIEGQELRVRYIGIDTPETVDPRRPVGCFGREASERNRELVEGKTVGLEKDVSETDSLGRLLRYVWADGRMVNATLVEEGYAQALTYPPDLKYDELFMTLERQAREASRGLWGEACEGEEQSSAGLRLEPLLQVLGRSVTMR